MEFKIFSIRKVKRREREEVFECIFKCLSYEQEFFLFATIPTAVLNKNYIKKGNDVHIYAHSISEVDDLRVFDITANFDENFLSELRKLLVEKLVKENKKEIINDRYKLMSSYFCDTGRNDIKLFEAKFKDMFQVENDFNCYIFVCISDFETKNIEEGSVYIYAHSYEDTCNIEDYDITSNFTEEALKKFKEVLIKELHERLEN